LETDAGDLPARASKDLEFITTSALRMQKLVSDLLDLSRAGSSQLNRERIALNDCVRTALEALSLRIEEASVQVTVDDLPEVYGDQTLLNQLFQNLISNALKFVSTRTPEIHVTCTHENGNVVIGVRDNGIGIDPQYVDKIFAPFKRLHGRKDYEGTGIGLAIARKAVLRHRGRIWVESEPDHGAHFKFTLSGIASKATTSGDTQIACGVPLQQRDKVVEH
jgi:signal transduction histidine kinase